MTNAAEVLVAAGVVIVLFVMLVALVVGRYLERTPPEPRRGRYNKGGN